MALYQDYRPHQFSDVVGQEPVTTILQKQALTRHYHHAYLFYGASGSGKTTTARILAQCLNCSNLDGTGEPCNHCQSCEAILAGRHWDTIEVDGARFRGVEDAKDLAYKAHFSPMGKYKIYLIDECHQLTEPAWNALLKLIEEPPPYLVIMLVTTRFDKIPETVSSRCELLPFNKIKQDVIKAQLADICQKEGSELDPNHLQFIAEKANGNLRSAENLLEECLVLKE